MGAFTDVEIYDAILRGDATSVLAVTETIAGSLVANGIRAVVDFVPYVRELAEAFRVPLSEPAQFTCP
jgi:hypothetical protein